MDKETILNKLIKKETGNSGPKRPEKWGLVLSGGGTKGAYEIGAWKAINELKIPVKGITGTSIGALNAGLFLSADMKTIEKIYRSVKITDVLPVGSSINPHKNVFDPSNLLAITKQYFRDRGLDNTPLRALLDRNINVEKIYESKLDLGIVTFDIKSRVAFQIFKEDIPKEKLNDYLLASANFPIFKAQQVDGKQFMDGGLYDNMPFNPLVERGYTHLIVIDINGIGMTRKLEKADRIYVKMIGASEDLGGTFEFNPERIDRNIKLGYLDTLKAFHKLFGSYYFFRRPAFNDLMQRFDLETINGLETAAKLYGLDRYRVYTADDFLDRLEAIHDEKAMAADKNAKAILNRSDMVSFRKLVQSGSAIAVYAAMLEEKPTYHNSLIDKTWPEIARAADAIDELKNYRLL